MGSIDPEDADYVCTLDDYSLEKAKRELFEDPKQRLGAVKTLRQWIRSQAHFTCRTDTTFLLQVLRTAKFSQLRAREIIENILTMRTKCPEYMANLDTHEPGLLKYVERGVSFRLPGRDKEGRGIAVIRIGQVDLKDPVMSVKNQMRSSLAIEELMKEKDENVIVNGVHLVFDCTGCTMKHLLRETKEEQKNTTKIYQDCNLGRLKALHFYNAGAVFEFFLGVMKQLMKKKYLERVHAHDNMESLYKFIPMHLWPEEYLPDDYTGPNAGTTQSILDDLKKRLMEPGFRKRLLEHTHERYKIDLSKKDSSVPQESFRKLNID